MCMAGFVGIRDRNIGYEKCFMLRNLSPKDVELGNQSEKNAIRKENIVRKAIQIEKREYNYYIYKGK